MAHALPADVLKRLFEAEKRLRIDNPGLLSFNFRYRITDAGVELDISNNPRLRKISALQRVQISHLYAASSGVDDIGVLTDMPLRVVDLTVTAVTDLKPLVGTSLERLNLRNTPVEDLSPLKRCQQLKRLVLPSEETGLDDVRALKQVEHLSYSTWDQKAEDFWS
jgi:hypothetical protein